MLFSIFVYCLFYPKIILIFFLVEEWRSKWFLERRWQKCGTDELIKAMSDINDHVRLAAVSACSKAAELRQMKKEEHHLGMTHTQDSVPTAHEKCWLLLSVEVHAI